MMNPERIIEMASAFYESCVLFAAVELDVFGRLSAKGRSDAGLLAESLGVDRDRLRLLLDACVAVGLLEKEGAEYRNTAAAAAMLVKGAPGDVSGALAYNRDVYAAWGGLAGMVRTGRPAEDPSVHLGRDPVRTRSFAMSMFHRAMGIGRVLIPRLDLRGCRKLLDVGGGPAAYSMLMAQAWPELNCTVMDLPAIAAIASELVESRGLSQRVRPVPGDYHDASFPADQDVVVFFGVLHQESPDSIRGLFRKARASLVPGGQVYVMDLMTDATHTQPKFSALFAVNMALTTTNGWVFSDEELGGWLAEAGFRDFEVAPVGGSMPHWLARARVPR